MFNFEKITSKVAGLKKSSEFAKVVPELADQLAAAQFAADDLKDRLEKAIFDSPNEVSGIQAQLENLQAEEAALRMVIAGAQRRELSAAAAEKVADLENGSKEAKKVQARLHRNYLELHECFATAATLLEEIRKDEESLKANTERARAHDRKDLFVFSPWRMLSDVISMTGHVNEHPTSAAVLPGYFPRRHPNGPALAHMKDVRL